jgi:hypothetical protein
MYDLDDEEEFFWDDEIGLVRSRKFFSRKRWADIARSTRCLDEIPEEMKREIVHLFGESLTFGPDKTQERAALKKERAAVEKLARYLDSLKAKVCETQRELNSEDIVGSIQELLEQIEIARVACASMLRRTILKTGRPRTQSQLVYGLLDIYAKYTGRPIGLSRNSKNRPTGPCYRFLSAFGGWISIKGLEGRIIAKRNMAKTTQQNRKAGHGKNHLAKNL